MVDRSPNEVQNDKGKTGQSLSQCHEHNSKEFQTCREGRMKKSSPAGRLTT